MKAYRGGQRYSSMLTSGLDGCQSLTSHPAQFNPGKEPLYPMGKRTTLPFNRGLDGPHSQSG